MKLALGTIAVTIAALSSPAAAQVSLEANAARAEGNWGAELGGGYTLISIGGFRMTPGAGLFLYDGREDGYSEDADGRCVQVESGASAKSELCDGMATKLYARAEATFTLPLAGASAGFGARYMSGNLRPYGTVSVPLLPLLHLKGNAGPKYLAAGIGARF